MARLTKLLPIVQIGVCILLSGCGGHEGGDAVSSKPAQPPAPAAPVPTASEGSSASTPESKRALHRQGAANRREQASHKGAPQ